MALEIITHDNRKVLFLHIPKTGGTWITDVIKNRKSGVEHRSVSPKPGNCSKHGTLSAYDSEKYDFIMFFLRSPRSWYESWWKFNYGRWKDWGPGSAKPPTKPLHGMGCDDFTVFVQRCLEEHPGFVTQLYDQYWSPERYKDGSLLVGVTENLREHLNLLLRTAGVKHNEQFINSAPRANVSTNRQATWYSTEELKMMEYEIGAYSMWNAAKERFIEINERTSKDF